MPKDDVAQPRKLIAFAFWELRRLLLAISGDWIVDFRAMALLVLTEFCVIFSALEFGSITSGRRLIPPGHSDAMVLVLFLAITITALNQFAVSHENHWKQYESEFEGYSKLTKAIGIVVMAVLPPLSGATAIWLTGAMVALPRQVG
jgi:hypothetical protein